MSIFDDQLSKMETAGGFIAALDQSGGSTPRALTQYGIAPDAWSGEDEMFELVHAMRTRIVTSPSFDGDRILGAILFEGTMDREIDGKGTAEYLWSEKRVVPFLKIDKGLAAGPTAGPPSDEVLACLWSPSHALVGQGEES